MQILLLILMYLLPSMSVPVNVVVRLSESMSLYCCPIREIQIFTDVMTAKSHVYLLAFHLQLSHIHGHGIRASFRFVETKWASIKMQCSCSWFED